MTTSDSTPKSATSRNQRNTKEHTPATRTIAPGAFAEEFIEEFSARTALRLLRQDNAQFSGFRECALAALCTWIFAPNDDELRRDAIAVAAAAHLKKIEKPAVNAKSKEDKLRIVAYMLKTPEFYDEIYYPLGGIATVSTAKTPADISRRLKKYRTGLDRAITMMRIGHWVFDLKDPNLLPPSVERSSRAAKCLINKDPRTFKSDWAKHRQNIAFAYAASTIQTKNNRNLLDLFQKGNTGISFEDIDRLCNRAKYINDHILELQYRSDVFLENTSSLPIATKREPFEAAPPDKELRKDILDHYGRTSRVRTAKDRQASP